MQRKASRVIVRSTPRGLPEAPIVLILPVLLIFFSDDHPADVVVRFPWRKDSSHDASSPGPDVQGKPGEYIVQSLFLEFCQICERKVEQVLSEPLVRNVWLNLECYSPC